MPNITQLDDTVAPIHAEDGGAQAWNQYGYRVDRDYTQLQRNVNEVGEAWEKHVTNQQTLTGIKNETAAALQDDQGLMDARAADLAAPTHDPNWYNDFRAKVQERVEAGADAYSTPEGKSAYIDRSQRYLRGLDERGVQSVSETAGIQAGQDAEQTSKYAIGRATLQGMDGLHDLLADNAARRGPTMLAAGGNLDASSGIETHIQGTGKAIALAAAQTTMSRTFQQALATGDPEKGAAIMADAANKIAENPDFIAAAPELIATMRAEGIRQGNELRDQINGQHRQAREDAQQTAEAAQTNVMERLREGKTVLPNDPAWGQMKGTQLSSVLEYSRKLAEPDPVAQEGSFLKAFDATTAAASSGRPYDVGNFIRGMGGAGKPGYSEAQMHTLVEYNKSLVGGKLTAGDKIQAAAGLASLKADTSTVTALGGKDKIGDAAYEAALATYLPLVTAARANHIPEAAIWDRTGKSEGSIFAIVPFNAQSYKTGARAVSGSHPAAMGGPAKGASQEDRMNRFRAIAGLK